MDDEIIAAALEIAESAFSLLRDSPEYSGADIRLGGTSIAESLKHPKHAATLKPIRTDAEALMRKFFRRQGRKLLKQISGHLRILGEHNVNAKEDDSRTDAKNSISAAIPDGMLLPLSITSGMKADYSKALEAVLTAGYTGLAEDLDSTKEISSDVVGEYLREHSLTKLTGGLNGTTVERLRNALADAYEAGADYDGLVEAVKDEYADFGSVRTGMIAQTEMNAAYNTGRKQIGLDLGFNEKSWNPDGTACLAICIPNVLQGWIGMDEEFESGDEAPPGHPNCDCSLDVRLNADLQESIRMREGWVTINGAHVLIGADGIITKGPAALIGKPHTDIRGKRETLSKAEIAKLTHQGGKKSDQDVAEATEHELSGALGLPKSADNKPFDLQSKKVGVEIKTLTSGTNDKVTMKAEAMTRKASEIKASKLSRTYTVIVDKRPKGVGTSTGQTRYFVREGYGSFRLGGMTEVSGTSGLSKFMRL